MKSLYYRYSSRNMHYSTKSTSLNQARATLNQVLITFPLLTPPPQWGARRRDVCVNQTRPFFPTPQIKMEKSGLATRD